MLKSSIAMLATSAISIGYSLKALSSKLCVSPASPATGRGVGSEARPSEPAGRSWQVRLLMRLLRRMAVCTTYVAPSGSLSPPTFEPTPSLSCVVEKEPHPTEMHQRVYHLFRLGASDIAVIEQETKYEYGEM